MTVEEAPQKATKKQKNAPPPGRDGSTRELTGRFVREWVAPYWKRLAITAVLMLVVSLATGGIPLVVERLFTMLRTQDPRVVYVIPTIVVVLMTIRALALYGQAILLETVVARVIANFQFAMFKHLLGADLKRLTREASGTLISRFTNDVNQIRNGLSTAVTAAARDFLTIVVLIGVLLYLDLTLSIIVLVVYPIAAIPIWEIGRRLRQVSKRTQTNLGDMTALLGESLSGARMVKTYHLEDYEAARAKDSFERNYKLRIKAIEAKSRLDPMLEFLGGLAIAGVVVFAGYRAMTDVSSVDKLIAFITALLMASQPVRSIGKLNAALQEALAAVQRIFDLLDEKPEIVDAPHAIPLALSSATLEFEHVNFGYEDGSRALKDFNLTVPGGQMVALVGRSGAGKSTVFNLIPRLFDVNEGSLRIDGQDVRDVSLASLRGSIGMVSQDAILFNDTVRANIAFGKMTATEDEIIAAASAAAAHDFIAAMPEGYDTIVGDRGFKLSGGERQRISLARAILKDAPILLLDEATSALDAESEGLVQAALEDMAKGRTTIAIAHRLATVRKADRICVMEAGRVVEEGTHEALLAQDGIYAKLAKLQFRDDDPSTE